MVRSELLEGNPLGDPAVRPLYVYRPAAADGETGNRLPSVYLLQGFGGELQEWLTPSPSGSTTTIERLDAMFSRGDAPPALIVFVDASTSVGGSQFLNSPGCGRYLDYLCDEVIPFVDARYPTLSERRHRGVSGKSSGGYGAMVISMLRPDVFGALASHAGDALFQCCYQPFFPVAARLPRNHFEGSWERFDARMRTAGFDWRQCAPLFAVYGMACAYSPDPDRPGKPLIPFNAVGRAIDEIWSLWSRWIPSRWSPAMLMRCVACAGSISMPAVMTSSSLTLEPRPFPTSSRGFGIDHTLELFDGNHDGVDERIPTAIRELANALQ